VNHETGGASIGIKFHLGDFAYGHGGDQTRTPVLEVGDIEQEGLVTSKQW
jgi:hypothetical protein